MLTDISTKTSVWQQKFIDLGIKYEFIEQSGLNEDQLKAIFNIIKFLCSCKAFKIISAWQLQIFNTHINFPIQDFNINSVDDNDTNIAHYAALAGNLYVLDWIYQNSPEILFAKYNHGLSISHYAAWSGNVLTLEWVASKDPNLLNALTTTSKNIAHYASRSGNLEILLWVFNYNSELLISQSTSNQTILHEAISSGSLEVIEWIYENLPELCQRQNQFTFAHWAALNNNVDFLRWIENREPKILFQRNKTGKNIAHFASENKSLDVLNWIKENHSELLYSESQHGETVGHFAARGGPKSLNWIKNNCEELLFPQNHDGFTIAHYAVNDINIDSLNWILINYFEILSTNAHLNNGTNIAHLAAMHGKIDSLKWIANYLPELINAKTDINQSIGLAAIYSEIYGDVKTFEVLDFLLENYPITLMHWEFHYVTIAHVAADHGFTNVLDWIFHKWNNDFIYKKDISGKNIAHYAANSTDKNSYKSLQWIFKNCPQFLEKKCNNGNSIADYALRIGDSEKFNFVLSLMDNSHQYEFSNLFIGSCFTVINKALETNFTLTNFVFPDNLEANLNAQQQLELNTIRSKVQRNQNILKHIIAFSAIAPALTQEHSIFSKLNLYFLFNIFRQDLPKEVDLDQARFFFNNHVVNKEFSHKPNFSLLPG